MGGQAANHRLARRLVLLACVMFGFGYALVPLYDAFCKLTGLNGKPERRLLGNEKVDVSREIEVELMANVSPGFEWEFQPVTNRVRVRPGQMAQVFYYAKNLSAHAMTGRAVPSIAPHTAAKYFIKTDCFCFTEQSLASGESKEMPVRFFVDPKLPRAIGTLTLSYTFFGIEPAATAGGSSLQTARLLSGPAHAASKLY